MKIIQIPRYPLQQQAGLKVQQRGCAQSVVLSDASVRKLNKQIKNVFPQLCESCGGRKRLNKLISIPDNVQHSIHILYWPNKLIHPYFIPSSIYDLSIL